MATKAAEQEFDALCTRLGGDAPEGLRALSAAQLKDLNKAISEARRRQGHALAAAGDRALSHVPRVLRGPIRKITG
ncbi:MAG: hypothetical protein ABI323_11895 [Solirubrobacteraceae bacterium]